MLNQLDYVTAHARTIADLDNLARMVWGALAEGAIEEEQAEAIHDQVEARRKAIGGGTKGALEYWNSLTQPEDAASSKATIPQRGYDEPSGAIRPGGGLLRNRLGPQDRHPPSVIHRIPSEARQEWTARKGGIGPEERSRFEAAVAYMGQGYELWLVTVAAHEQPERVVRKLVNEAFRQIMEELTPRRAGASKRYWVRCWHATPTLHAHAIVAMPKGEGERLQKIGRRSPFSRYDTPTSKCFHVGPADGPAGPIRLAEISRTVAYCMGEITPAAAWRGRMKPRYRKKGSHRLASGGDRVSMSKELEADLVAAGRIERHRRTYAKVAKPTMGARLAPTEHQAVEASTPPPAVAYRDNLFHQLADHVMPARPPLSTRRRLPAVEKDRDQIALGFDRPLDIRAHLQAIPGRTDAEKAAAIGLSRPQFTNLRNGMFGTSRPVVQRILQFAASAAS